jgi:spermidine/putrescine-binding protein
LSIGTSARSAAAAQSVAASAAPPASASAQNFGGATINIIALDGEDGKKELEAWRTANNVQFAITPNSGWDATFAKLKTDQFDIALVANPFVTQWATAGILTPIDTTRLSNWNSLFPGLRDGDFLRKGAQVYAVPIAWGDGPYVYDPAKIKTPPKSIAELVDPAWTNPIVMFDDPILSFHMIAVSLGFNPSQMTKDQLAQVVDKTKVLVKHVTAFVTGYQDATDYLVRGEADLSLGGWEAMLQFGKDKGKTLKFDFFTESHGGGWCDSWAIPSNAKNVDAAYAAIDAIISPDVNAQVATNLISGTVNSTALDKVDPSAKIYDYSIVQSTANIKFEDWNPPLTAPAAGAVTKADWDAAWKNIRSGV